jgi:hypothetical protein
MRAAYTAGEILTAVGIGLAVSCILAYSNVIHREVHHTTLREHVASKRRLVDRRGRGAENHGAMAACEEDCHMS